MPIDNRTANLELPLPDQSNSLIDDVLRLITSLQLIDAAVAGKVTQADVDAAVAALVDSSPAALNTLKELSTALGNDANFATTLTTALALKAPIASPTFTGTVSGITAAMVGAPAGSGTSTGTNTGDQDLSGKQDLLVSGTSIKTLNGESLLGSGDIGSVTSVNGMTGNVVLPPVQTIAYDARATLRTQTPADGEQAIVDGLGLFVWQPGSTEPDDDESAFATATGVWLLEAAHWDLVDSWQAPDDDVRDAFDEDEPLRFASSFASSFASKVLTGSATCAITSVSVTTSTSFTGTVTGAAIGDRVIATPPNQLGSTAADTGLLSYHAWVSAADTVTIMLTNASTTSANTNTAIRTAWPITVIKP